MEKPDWGQLLEQALTAPGLLSTAYSVFHHYSLSNRILAVVQLEQRNLPIAPIASYKRWQELGRIVKRGEKALSLIMPITVKKKTDDGNIDSDEVDVFKMFRMKRLWFSLDQTEGEVYQPEIEIPEWNKAVALEHMGITEEPFSHINGNIMGYASPVKMAVAINPLNRTPWKTLFHEIAHCLLHNEQTVMVDGEELANGEVEAEAECVAYLCCATLGLPGLDKSRGYIQHWLSVDEKKASDFTQKSASRIFAASDRILKAGSVNPKDS